MPRRPRRRRSRRRNPETSRARFAHQRLADPRQFDPRSFRTVVGARGHRLVVGCPRGHWHGGACRVGTRAQALLHPQRERNPEGCPEIVDVSMVAVPDAEGRLHPVPPEGATAAATNPRRRRYYINLEGFVDDEGRFHPIRASADYDRARAGEPVLPRRWKTIRVRRPRRAARRRRRR